MRNQRTRIGFTLLGMVLKEGSMVKKKSFGAQMKQTIQSIGRTLYLSALFLAPFPLQISNASPIVDQEQPVIDATVGGLAIGGSSKQTVSQVVTASVPGPLAEVRLPVACDTGSDLLVEIETVAGSIPSGTVLTSQTISGSTLPPFFSSPPAFRSMVFSEPVVFSAGDQFAIVLRSSGSCSIFQGPIGDSYLGGDGFFDSRPNPPGWVCFCEFAGARFDLPFQTVVGVSVVSIDIKPGSFPNSINLASAGTVPVAILSSATFDATQVDPATVTLAGAKVKLIGKGDRYSCSSEDVNGDGLPDLVCHVTTVDFLIEPGDSMVLLEAVTYSGVHIQGQDSIQIVP